MARIKLLVDTDIIIDALKGVKPARALLRSQEIDIYCSVLTRKELLSKEGLKDSEKKKITGILSKVKILKVDKSVQKQFNLLLKQYIDRPEAAADYIIAATALAKKLPLLTRNRKHFEYIKELVLSPVYDIDS
jgi:predicted nucleic acid-binding protein